MKRKSFRIILVTDVIVALLLCFLCGCTGDENSIGKGTANKVYDKNLSKITQPVFSDRGGFYGNKMALKISVPATYMKTAATMRVTFDCSEPTMDSQEYDGSEIILPDAACVTTEFEKEEENVSVTVIRAACFDIDGNMLGQIATATYIRLPNVNGKVNTKRFNMPVISLVTDDNHLNNPGTGILEHPDKKNSDWERPVNVAFYEANGQLAFTQDAGIRLSGSSSRSLAQKSFRITARDSIYFNTDIYKGAGKFKYALFPNRLKSDGSLLEAYDSFILRNGGNDSLFVHDDSSRISMMRDGLTAMIAQKAAPEVDAMAYRPVVVFLNGEYYGILNMREYENNKYIQNVYGILDKPGVTVISSKLNSAYGGRYDGTWFYYEQEDGPNGELSEFVSLLNGIVISDAYSFDEAAEQIDMNSFMKYCAINLFVCNTDWPHNNINVWRYAGADQINGVDGKWHFMIKDTDVSLGRYVCGAQGDYPIELYTKADSRNFRLMLSNYLKFDDPSGYPSISENSYPDSLYIQGLFYFCMKNDGFASQFYDYCNQLATQIWTSEALEKLINDSAKVLENEIQNNFVKNFGSWQWQSDTNFDDWQNAVSGADDSLITWARDRSGADGEFLKQVNELRDLLS